MAGSKLSQDALEQLGAEIEAAGGEALAIRCDVSEPAMPAS